MKIHAESFLVNKAHVRFFLPAERALKFSNKLRLSLKTVTSSTKGVGWLPQAKVKRGRDKNGGKEEREGRETLGCQDRITPHYSAARSQ